MVHNNEIAHGKHFIFSMHVNPIFVTKYKRNIFIKESIDAHKTIFTNTCHKFEAELVEINGEDDHVHLLANYPP